MFIEKLFLEFPFLVYAGLAATASLRLFVFDMVGRLRSLLHGGIIERECVFLRDISQQMVAFSLEELFELTSANFLAKVH